MTYVPYSVFNPAVLPFCNGVPEVVAQDAIRNAAIEFCEESHWLQYTPDLVSGVSGIATYQLDTPNDTIPARITNAWWDTYLMQPKSEDQLRDLCGVDWRTIQGTPRYYTQTDDPTEIIMVPYPLITEINSFSCLVALRPNRASLTCDQNLYEWWYETIAHGALARLQSTPQQSYTNQKEAARHLLAFWAGIGKAKIDRNRGLQRANIVMRPPRIF